MCSALLGLKQPQRAPFIGFPYAFVDKLSGTHLTFHPVWRGGCVAFTSGSKGQLITLPSVNNGASLIRQIDIWMDGHGKLHHSPRLAASWDTAPVPAAAERCDTAAANQGEREECGTVIKNTCWIVCEGGYQETDIALLLNAHTNSDTHKGVWENIPKQGDAGHAIYFPSVLLPPQQDFSSNCKEKGEHSRPAQDLAIRSSQKW